MGHALVKNNAYSTLLAGIASGATTLTVATGHGARFPVVSGGNFFYATLIDVSNNLEIIKVVTRAGDVFTIQRGQDGTTARAFLTGDRIEIRPVAGLFDDKLPLDGGTLSGPLVVPAGATLAQVPRIQDVVQRGGDTMTGTLITTEVQTPILKSQSAGLITVPTGHRISAADVGAIAAPGMIVQTQYTRVDTVTSYSYTSAAGNAVSNMDITALNVSFTPKYASSKVLLQYMVNGDANHWDWLFALRRNGTLIGQNVNDANRWSGLAGVGYMAADSRPETWSFFYMDSPASVAAQAYVLQLQCSLAGANARTFYLNRTLAVPQSSYESGISQILIQEIAQ